MNYNLEMEKQMKKINEGEKILLHACCAPCSSACIERLADLFEIYIYYFNPNITNRDEYLKRLEEVDNFISKLKTKFPIHLVEGEYNPKLFFDISRGLENEPERGARCYKCYELRLEETARKASEMNINYFASTLTLSPYKNSSWVNEIGKSLDLKYNSHYLYSDFKKKNGYKRSIELSKIYNLYRQNYCGCVYSIREGIEE